MIKVIDIDKLFDEYIKDYVYSNVGKVKPEEIENQIPVLYEKFGDEKLKELDGKTPNTFYVEYQIKDLLVALKEHIEKDVSVSDFLCEAITKKSGGDKEILALLMQDNGEEYTVYLMNMLADMGGEIPAKRYLEFVLYDERESVYSTATEFLAENANRVKEDILEVILTAPENRKINLLEILAGTNKDDRVFDILVGELEKAGENLALIAQFIAKYGDERAIPYLVKAIENDNINYADFEELRFSIEALGGEYDKKRDFSSDKFYKKIMSARK